MKTAAVAPFGTRIVSNSWATSTPEKPYKLTTEDEKLLEEIERAAFLFFWEATNPHTGLIKDRSQANGPDSRDVASIASVGFGLSAMCIADKRGWADSKKITERVRNTLRFLWDRVPHEHGWYYHFLNMNTGERVWKCELSSIDTAIMLCGILTARAYFNDGEIHDFATKIYHRIDYPWMLNAGNTLSMGWKPESGFLEDRWNRYCELMMIYLVGYGSPTHPLDPATWKAWKRQWFDYDGIQYISTRAPLFIHQFSHAWFDFRDKEDDFTDYFDNSVKATVVHKKFCQSLRATFPDYSENLWGVTASDSAHGYTAWGGPPPLGPLDGSVVPCATAGSLPFLPVDCLRVQRYMREKYGDKAWKKYGFVDAFNPLKSWYNPDVIGIDLGISLLMAENLRSGFVWETFMKNEEAQKGMKLAGFHAKKPAK